MITPDSILKDLKKIGKKEALQKLHNLYAMSDEIQIRKRILEILNDLQDNTHFEEIESYFISEQIPEIRIEAAKLLAFNYERSKAIKPLIWVFENEQKNEVKRTALRLLVALSFQKNFRELIINCLKKALESEDDPKLIMDAAESLGFIKAQSAVEELIKLLNSSKKGIRIKAIKALGELGDEKTVPQLIENLGLDSYDVWNFAFEALNKILEKEELVDFLTNALMMTENSNDQLNVAYLRQGLSKALGEIGDKRAIPSLINVLKDFHYWVREDAIAALNKIDPQWQDEYRGMIKEKKINLKRK